MEDIFNIDLENKVMGRAKEVRYANDPPKVLNC